jgi:hypothetical protein
VEEGDVIPPQKTTVARDIEIDIMPETDLNPINLRKKGVIPVAILGGTDFDVSTVDPSTLEFAGVAPKHDLTNPITFNDHLKDVNGDGETDLVAHFSVRQLALEKGTNEVTLMCESNDGQLLRGTGVVTCK